LHFLFTFQCPVAAEAAFISYYVASALSTPFSLPVFCNRLDVGAAEAATAFICYHNLSLLSTLFLLPIFAETLMSVFVLFAV
ncbi:MAG: hypothetical protein Q8920_01095, partial [Bacillota bacterium]|nr:hypothetical protein [Bacillota bacterium]